MLKGKFAIGFLIILLVAAVVYSYFVLGNMRKREPNKAKLVMAAEVVPDESKRDLRAVQGEDNCG